MKYPYPIKDFTKPKQYPDPDKRSSALLAWEFLRRNPKYQKDFDKFKKLKSPAAKRQLQEKWLPGIPSLTLFDPKDNQPRGLKLALHEIFLSIAPVHWVILDFLQQMIAPDIG